MFPPIFKIGNKQATPQLELKWRRVAGLNLEVRILFAHGGATWCHVVPPQLCWGQRPQLFFKYVAMIIKIHDAKVTLW
jgi:hypothetical protein